VFRTILRAPLRHRDARDVTIIVTEQLQRGGQSRRIACARKRPA
jgi:hypothetical protein